MPPLPNTLYTPWITALIYLIARGKGMAERAQEAAAGAKKEADDYIRQAAGRSPTQEIAEGALLDNRKQARTKPFAAQLNAGSTPRSATDIAAREH